LLDEPAEGMNLEMKTRAATTISLLRKGASVLKRKVPAGRKKFNDLQL
jgi:hypothetical protein